MQQTFLDAIRTRINQHRDQEAYLFTNPEVLRILDQRLDTPYEGHTYGAMDLRFRAVAAALQQVAKKGDRVLVLHEPGEGFVTAFMGCLYAGMVAVPIYPPNPARLERTLPYFLAVIQDAAPAVVLTNEVFKVAAADFLSGMEGFKNVPILLTAEIPSDQATSYETCAPTDDEVAFFQYTSGSTGRPRGVMLTHGNLANNLNQIRSHYAYTPGTRQVFWLPPYHDMGLVTGILAPLYNGGSSFLMSPMEFLQDPNRWIQAMHWYKADGTGGPNFGFEITAKKFKPETFKNLDLSRWVIAANGAEPIKFSTLEKFAATFGPYGFHLEAFCPSYGMSETTNMVSGGLHGTLVPRYVQRGALEKNRKVIELPHETSETRTVVSCGKIGPDFDVRVVDPITLKECAQDRAGEIWLKGGSIGKGYWNDAEKTAATFNATLPETNESGFLRTGDYGFIRDEQIYITGRLKDLIIIRGRNYHPEDIEHTLNQAHPNFAPGACAAFAADDEHGERLVVVQELLDDRPDFPAAFVKEMFQKASIAVSDKHGIQLSELVLIPRRTLHKTGSGKISRVNNYQAWNNQTFTVLYNNQVDEFITNDLPLTDTEKRLAAIWERLLKVNQVERSGDFLEYGGDSMAVVELSAAIRTAFDFRIAPEMIYVHSVLSALARVIDEQQTTLTSINLDHEVSLNLTAETVAQLPAPNTQHQVILLTGATGFLGSYLLHTLVQVPTVEQVVVLVRNQDLEKAKERLHKVMQEHQLPTKSLAQKVVLCYGDLSRPRLGLSMGDFEALGAKVDTIYHCGAQVDWVKPYTHLRAANVDGTRALLQLATTTTLKPFHYISTMWVVNSGVNTEVFKAYDETHRADWRGLENGYAQSKWVAENLVFKAADLGLPATSHRMDFIVGSAANGIIPERDFLVRMVQDCMKTGVISKEAVHLDVVQVDYLAESIVRLCQQQHAPGTVFHYRGAEQLSTDLMAELLTEQGYPIQKVPYSDWVATVTADTKNKSWPLKYFLEAYAMSPTITNPDHNVTNVVRYDRTIADLNKIGLSPNRDHATAKALFLQMVDYLESLQTVEAAPELPDTMVMMR